MKFDPKKNQTFLIVEGTALVIVIVLFVMWRMAVGGRDSALADFDMNMNDYTAISTTYDGAPGAGLTNAYQARLAGLVQSAGAMRTAVINEPFPEYTPTSFKTELKSTHDAFMKLRAEKNVNVPEDLGWGEYRGGVDPPEDMLPRLVRQYAVTKDVLDTLFSNNVDEIITIERNPEGADVAVAPEDEINWGSGPRPRNAQTREEALEKGKKVYDAVPVKFLFRIPPGSLWSVLAELRNKPHFYRVRKIKTNMDLTMIDVKDPWDIKEALVVEMTVDHIKLL